VDLSGDGGVRKRTIRAGRGEAGPPQGANVTVHYDGYLTSGVKFDSSRDRGQPFTFKLGSGQVIQAWDVSVACMRPSEFAEITCRSDYGYGWEGSPPKIPSDATLRFEIELLSWEPDPADMSAAEKLERAETLRAAGTAAFKAQQYRDARAHYQQAGDLAALVDLTSEPNHVEGSKSIALSCALNSAQCALKLEDWGAAVDAATRALGVDPASVKALYRRAVANTALSNFSRAKADLQQACALDPKSRDVREQFEKTKAAARAQVAAERAAFAGKLC